jgi:4-diphosphocytidyl-2-C-methyl-D-erythritol kinase
VTASAARVAAQAKINLLLRVLARESTGYHGLVSLFCRIDLADLVRVNVGGSGRTLDVTGASLGPMERNLAWRAALAYYGATGWPGQFAIELDKQIPVGGGLGGGSADAGAVLRALNALAPHPLPAAELLSLAATLGADVPFLTSTSALALGTGYGEKLRPLPALAPRPVVLACFDRGVSTREAYAWLDESRARSSVRGNPAASATSVLSDAPVPDGGGAEREALDGLPRQPTGPLNWTDVQALAANDFEPVVLAHRPDIATVRDTLRAAVPQALTMMTGSGATLVMVVESGTLVPVVRPRAGVTMHVSRTAAHVVEVERSD